MRGNFSGLLAQAQKMQKNVERAQAELANIEVTGEAGAGMVKISDLQARGQARRNRSESAFGLRRRQGNARRSDRRGYQ